MGNYYYYVAGLPVLSLEGQKNIPPYALVIADAIHHVDGPDKEHLRTIRLPFDNKNLFHVLSKKESEFDPRGSFSVEDLGEAIKNPVVLPRYMQQFLEAYKEQKPVRSELSWEDQLHYLFYSYTQQYPNEFIRRWYAFDYDLRNLLTGLNLRRMHEGRAGGRTEQDAASGTMSVLPVNETAESIVRSNAPDFGVGQALGWVGRVLSLDRDNLTEFEKNIDQIRWNYLDELTTFRYFSIEVILAFCIKLEIVERWQRLDPIVGAERLRRLVDTMKSGFEFSDTFTL